MVVEYIAATAAAVAAYRLSRRAYRDYLRPKIKGALGESGVKRELRKQETKEALRELEKEKGN